MGKRWPPPEGTVPSGCGIPTWRHGKYGPVALRTATSPKLSGRNTWATHRIARCAPGCRQGTERVGSSWQSGATQHPLGAKRVERAAPTDGHVAAGDPALGRHLLPVAR